MLPFIFIIIASIFVYRTAKQNGHKPVLWTVIAVVAFIVVQIAVGIFLAFGLVAIAVLLGWPASMVQEYAFLIDLLSLVPGIAAVMLVLRKVNVVRDDAPLPPRSATSIFDSNDYS